MMIRGQTTMSKKTIKIIQLVVGVIALLVILISAVNITKNVSKFNDLKQEEKQKSKKVKTAQKEYERYKNQVVKQTYAKETTNDNKLVKNVAVHNSTYNIMNNLSKKFFSEYFTWSNSKEYENRQDKLESVADRSLLDDEKLFDDAQDNLGGDYIKSLDIQSEYQDSAVSVIDNHTGLVRVDHKSWFDSKSKSSSGTRYYEVNFNRDSQKIKGIKLVFSEDNDKG